MLDDYVRFRAQTSPNAPAFIHERGKIPYWKYEADIRRAVYTLSDLKVEPGQPVSVALRPGYLHWILVMALARLGIASAPQADVQAPCRITDDAQLSGDNVFLLSPQMINSILSGPEREWTRRNVDPDSLGRVFLTSGTTGTPKRIAMSWRGFSVFTMDLVSWLGGWSGTWWGMTSLDTPGGYCGTVAAAACGYATPLGLVFSVATVLKLKPAILGLLPVHVQFLLENLPRDCPKWPLAVVSGGSTFPAELASQVRERLTPHVLSAYGTSETGMAARKDLDLMEREPLAAGYVVPGVRVRIVDDEGEEVPPGELGRICISSPTMATGYLGDPEATARHFRDGWFHSTDLGRLREDGLLFFEGRADEAMNLGGHKVLPGPIDAAVAGCPGVKEAAAFSFIIKGGVERCGIAVVATEGYDEAAIQRAATSKLMKIQRVEVLLVDALPRNDMGKVERHQLRDMMMQGQS